MFGGAYANVDFKRTEIDRSLSYEDQQKQAALLNDTNYNYLKRAQTSPGIDASKGPIDHNTFVKLQTQTFNKQLSSPYFIEPNVLSLNSRKIPSNDILAKASKGLQIWDPNTRQTSSRNIDIASYATNLEVSKELREANNACMKATLDDLINSTNYASKFRCGWLYKKGEPGHTPAVSKGYSGTKQGPSMFFKDLPPPMAKGERWFWDLEEAKKQILKDRCLSLTSCGDVGSTQYNGCAFSTTKGTGIPINKNGEPLYPSDPILNAPSKSLVRTPGNCPPPPPVNSPEWNRARSKDVCMPDQNGVLSRDCMLQQITAAGCSTDGTLYALMNQSTVPGNYSNGINSTIAYQTYQARAGTPLMDSVIKTGKIAKDIALLNFKQLKIYSGLGTNTAENYAARDLCIKRGDMDLYDFCSEIKDTDPPPFTLECIQKEWRKAGGLPAGSTYPTNSTAINNYYRTWGAYKNALQLAAANTKSTDRDIQERYLLEFMGIKLEKALTEQIPRINGTEVFWFNSATNTFIGRRLNTSDPKFPTFSTWDIVENTDRSFMIDYYALANVRPPTAMNVSLVVRTDDGMAWSLNTEMSGDKTKGKYIDEGSSTYGATKTGLFSVNWDQPPTTHNSGKPWTLRAGGPNYIVGYWHQAYGMSVSDISYKNSATGLTQPFPSQWMTLTQEPDAPMFSWQSRQSRNGTISFSERRFPSIMEIMMASTARMDTAGRLQIGSNGYASVKKFIGMNSWRTLTLLFTATNTTMQGISAACGLGGFPSSDNGRIRSYTSDDCASIGGNWAGNGECLMPGGGSYSWQCRGLNTQNPPIILQFGPITVGMSGTTVSFQWNSATLKANHAFNKAVVPDGNTFSYLTINMRSRYAGQYPDTVSVYCGVSKDTNPIDPSKIKTFSTAKSDPIYSKTDTAMLVLGDKNALNSANISVTALRLFDYELDINDLKRDRENSWLMNYFEP